MSDKIIQLSSEAFESTVSNSSIPLVVDFWAPWCGPCKAIAPILDDLAEELSGKAQICKLNIDDHPSVAEKFSIKAIPTLLIFKGGEVVETLQGIMKKGALKEKVEAHF